MADRSGRHGPLRAPPADMPKPAAPWSIQRCVRSWSGPGAGDERAGPVWTSAAGRSSAAVDQTGRTRVLLVQGGWTKPVDRPDVGPAPWTEQCVDQVQTLD